MPCKEGILTARHSDPEMTDDFLWVQTVGDGPGWINLYETDLVGGFNPSKNISQNENLSPGRGEHEKYVWNHHLDYRWCSHKANHTQMLWKADVLMFTLLHVGMLMRMKPAYIHTFTAQQQLRGTAQKNVSHKMSHTIIASYVIIFHGKSIDHSISPRISPKHEKICTWESWRIGAFLAVLTGKDL